MKEESLSIMIVKTLLAVVIFAGMWTIIIGGGYIIGEYYKNKVDDKVVKQIPVEEFCNSNILENCDGKRVNINGTLEYIPKGPIPIITKIENRNVEYNWAGGVFLMQDGGLLDTFKIAEGSAINIIGTVYRGGQPCGKDRPEQCLASYHATQIEVESLKVVESINQVTITTDKMEYEWGETVRIIFQNNLKEDIILSHCRLSSFPVIEKFENNEWDYWGGRKLWEDYPRDCEFKISANNQEIYIWDQKDNFNKPVLPGTYRVNTGSIFVLGIDEKIGGDTKTYSFISNEFTIKEKSALDPRCGEKVKIIGDCDAEMQGYEFNLDTGKCITVNGSGCSVETPFKSLEECQEVCEKKENVVLPDEDELIKCNNDSDCVLVNSNCCSCNMGGAMICINKKYLENWNRRLSCQDEINRMCPAVYLCDDNPTGCECINNVCQGTEGGLTKL